MGELSEIYINGGKLVVKKKSDNWMLILYRSNQEDFFLKGMLKIASFTPQEADKIIDGLKKGSQIIAKIGSHEKLRICYETLILAFIECSLVRITSMN